MTDLARSVDYELCADEQEAVSYAYQLAESEQGAVSGVQFADGRLIERDEWQALHDYEEERYRAWRDSANREPSTPSPPTRRVRSPFGDQPVSAPADAPDWLGR